MNGENEKITVEEWARARRQGYAHFWDTHPYMLRLDRETGATVWRPVEIVEPLIKRDRR